MFSVQLKSFFPIDSSFVVELAIAAMTCFAGDTGLDGVSMKYYINKFSFKVAEWKLLLNEKNLDFGRSLDIITQMIRRVVWLVYGSDGGDQLSDF